jgi:hypothetical protein
MRTGFFWGRLFIGCLLLVLIAGCTTAIRETPIPIPKSTAISPTDTPAPKSTPISPTDTPAPKSTPILPTDTPAPKSCEEVYGNCIKLSFDGENCVYDGPTDFKTGPVTLLFFNESGDLAAVNLMRLTGDKTTQDVIEYIGEEPSSAHAPSWTRPLGTWQVIASGKIYTWEGYLEPGIHAMVCASPLYGIWYGGGFEVED